MAIVRFRPFSPDPLRDFSDIQSEMNRLFDGFFGRPSHGTSGMDRVWAPSVDMTETKDELKVTADLPGLNEKEIHLSITGDVLTLRGERQWHQEDRQDNYYRGERWFGKFERAI